MIYPRQNLTLLTDLYQLTMCGGYFQHGIAQRESVFHLTFRRCPFGGEFAICCGLAQAIDVLNSISFVDDDISYLRSIRGNDEKPLFADEFLTFLRSSRFECDVHAIPEGTAVFEHEPLVRVQGPLWQCQLIETALLTMINFQTLIATKAARVCKAAGDDSVLEFGLRRAQGVDGGISASRAAFIGGVSATSNVLAGKLFDIPVKGTHAHSWVMTFPDEVTAFEKYAEAMPNNCVLLVDTYDTLQGVRNAIDVALHLRSQGHELIGVRLDSGDLCELSIEARRLLDEAGLQSAAIVASNDLDEYQIASLKKSGARINVWGVGTRLSTAFDQPALGGVYKLAAIRDDDGNWVPKIKLSEQPVKISDPGILQVERYSSNGKFVGDRICSVVHFKEDAKENSSDNSTDANLNSNENAGAIALGYVSGKPLSLEGEIQELLVPVFKQGQQVYQSPPATESRERGKAQLSSLPENVTRLGTVAGSIPEPYLVGVEPQLYRLKQRLIETAKREAEHAASRSR